MAELSKEARGFTLIEVMIVVAVIAILATIAFPSYLEHVRKARRADAQQYLMSLAHLNQRFFLDNRAFKDANTIAELLATPSSVATYYAITNPAPGVGPPPSFQIVATPQGSQAADSCGTLTITNTGLRTSSSGSNCW